MRSPHVRARIVRGALALSFAAVLSARAALAVDVTSCSQVIPDGEIGVLQADLVCPAFSGIGLGRGATLQLNGHTVAAEAAVLGQVGIGCFRGKCRIEGPGTVSGFKGAGIVGLTPSKLEVRGITVQGNGIGISGDKLRLVDLDITANDDWGASGTKLEATNVASTNNGSEGLGGYGVRLIDVTVSGNGANGVNCNRVTARNLTATGNTLYGVRSVYHGNTKLTDSTVSGNGIADVGSQHRPKLVGTTCGTSRQLNDGGADLGTWGLCTDD